MGVEEPGLLFYLSCEKGSTADFSAGGTPAPNFDYDTSRIADGAVGAGLRCGDLQRLCWSAPGNIYAQRGTLSFFWRSRYPVGPTEFPIFRVAYSDHSSWDMVWLRIDYNGHGFDAFVTDTGLARSRVSVPMQPFPKPSEWTHLAISWDETKGIRFYLNGKLAAKHETAADYDAGLDQFGPHSRIISPWQVQSDYNFARGGDIDEIRIYDRMLADEGVAFLAGGGAPTGLSAPTVRILGDPGWRREWWQRFGWNRLEAPPPYFPAPAIKVRKVEIHDAYDLKRWWWKACDGIRETTWPGVYNRSRLPGRNDYFQLPDWDCYVQSGKSITFVMPDEAWNQVEISGSAWGKMELLRKGAPNDGSAESVLFERPKGQVKTVHHLETAITGRKIRFTNAEQEEPISELTAYDVVVGREPAGNSKLEYRLSSAANLNGSLEPLAKFIDGRYEPDERAVLVAQPSPPSTPAEPRQPASRGTASKSLPLVHILIPCDSSQKAYKLDAVEGGLDGIAFDLPALKVRPTHGALFPLNIQVKDPLWPPRNMLDFTFSVKPDEAKTLWLDLRDRILPPGKSLYLTIAGAGDDFGVESLEGAALRLVFKSRESARAEHELDRFTQARDNYAMLVEEHPHSPKLNLWVRFEADIGDLLRVNPNHDLGRKYWAVAEVGSPHPAFRQPVAPAGVPLWAFRQVEMLDRVKRFVNWYIDNRQVEYGDFGGGISDDVDLLNTWPAAALMGCDPDKVTKSLRRLLEAAYANGMFTNGLPTIQADELHSYEEGIDCIGANMILDYGNPKQLERAMETSRAVAGLTGVNAAGHRHFRTCYFSGTKMATEEPWGWTKPYSYLILQPGQLLVDYNGNPAVRKLLLELADGLLAHRRRDASGRFVLQPTVQFESDREGSVIRGYFPWPLFWSSWRWSGDSKYLDPIMDGGPFSLMSVNANVLDILNLRKEWGPRFLSGEGSQPAEPRQSDGRTSARSNIYRISMMGHFRWQITGDKQHLEKLYASQIEEADLLEFINTEGSLWTDRVGIPNADLQRARLGGIALVRNGTFPGHAVSWRFVPPADHRSVAVLIPDATPTAFKIIAYNLDQVPVKAIMTGWNIDPGVWEVVQGIDSTGADTADASIKRFTTEFERSGSMELTFAPHAMSIITLKLIKPGTPYWQRPDLGISRDDVSVESGAVRVRIHSLGSVDAPGVRIVCRTREGRIISSALVPALRAPVDLYPKTADVILRLPAGTNPKGSSIEIDPDHELNEITRLNNVVKF